ncbi:hypothetical protein V495_06986, partial [Pseudogymnoascus sp. VKM F-4514 (FW-929)]
MPDHADNSNPPTTSEEGEPNPPPVKEDALDDWADNESVTTDGGESTGSPSKKNIHHRRWKLVSNENGSFVIEGGRRPMQIHMSLSEAFEDDKFLAEADFVLPHVSLHRSPGRNGHVSPGLGHRGYITRTLQTMREEFEKYQEKWLESSACTSLRGTILDLKQQDEYVPIDNIVCLSLGSLQDMVEECRERSFTQLAALMSIIEVLDLDPQTASGKFIAQDPVFTPLDAQFLASLGFVVVDDPEGFLAITPTTLVYSIAGYLDMDWVISQRPWPAALICGDTEAFIGRLVEAKETSEENLVVPT